MYAIILAAGLASRAGGEKLFWKTEGKSLVVHAVEAAVGAGLPTIVVTGFQGERVESLLACHPDITIVRNERYESGQLSSIQAGVRALPHAEDFFIALADMPLIRSRHYLELAGAWDRRTDGIRPMVGGLVGHPVLVKASLIPAILAAGAGLRMKDVLASFVIARKESGDRSYITDVDTLSSYQALLDRENPS
ncbi:MAG: nucleotidyltransferase family protein [Sphaerochaetaceae bacterium]|nr:nucleotidyltransferase family protein [Spirochaetales bacterium]MDY5500934.1 nucleotidyltransferase family protein [Sphaerochaetaceae bacterium]